MALNTPKLDTAVAEFKKLCDPHWQLYRYGQFYVTNRTVDDLAAQIESALTSYIGFVVDPTGLKPAIKLFRSKLNVPVMDVNVPGIMAQLNLIDPSGALDPIRWMFKPSKTDRADAQRDFNDLWSRTDLPAAPLWTGTATLPKAQAAFAIEEDRCWQVLRAFATMLLKKKRVAALPAAVQLSSPQLAGAFLKDAAPNRQEVSYPAAADLAGAVTKMKAVLAADGFVHCGLLSGARHERSKFPQPEHHVLVFAHDLVNGQDAFLFWDPDTNRSNIGSITWGKGFGLLFSRAGRLCTGIDDADLAGLDLDRLSPFFGDHNTQEPRRHCYQVYTLQSLPLPAAVKVHTKVMATPAHSSVDEMLDKAVWLYAGHGIELHEASREVIEPGSDLDRYQMLVVGDEASGPTAEVSALHAALRDRRAEFGVEPAAGEGVVAIVADLVPAARGSDVCPPDQPGVVLSAATAGEWTLAHEIGHLAGLEHTAGEGRLMSASTAGVETPQLTAEETQTFLASPLVQA